MRHESRGCLTFFLDVFERDFREECLGSQVYERWISMVLGRTADIACVTE